MVALLPAEFLLTRGFYAGHTGVVTALVLPGVAVYVVLVHFRDVSQEVSAGVYGVLAYASHLPPEAGELVLYLVKAHIRLRGDHSHHSNGLEAYGAAAPPEVGHLLPDELRGDVQDGGEGKGVEFPDLARGYHNIICHLVAHQDVSLAVIDDAAGGVDGLVYGGIAVCVFLEAGIEHLEGENLAQKQQNHCSKTCKENYMPVILRHLFAGIRGQ